ncbi:DNA replication/repair protein RecF [Hoyosella rhizosphaerae]|uniref:DNA replication and repair protein RecF n=1 Tax=Hoyosella rhizosphaerae TaxID=1755582 RepID=A0A916UAP6_9ACTN|nr:DNA replication/repair protein RecF [Hoyosella rhizosphaerae]MBN4927477.1 DNA replication/repair protein RecF [Hoyosella rhizosphaerae]GGC64151.1 DNA replication and repair protein RecF [Hoyosella rhizosphaerae]
MYLRHLALREFRSWHQLAIDLRPGCTQFLGPNGHGKTNILEAIQYLANLSSHRVAQDLPLIQEGSSASRVTGIVVNVGRELQLDLELHAGKANRARINTSPVRRPREILGIVQTVMFAPEDLSLVKGDPSERRKYLDELLTTRRPSIASLRSDYERVVRQRSALLKTIGVRRRGSDDSTLDTLDAWDAQLALYGAQLLQFRLEIVALLDPLVHGAYATLAPDSRPAHIRYRSNLGDEADLAGDVADIEALFLATLRRERNREIERGVCLVGPHRDDLELTLGQQPTKGYASQGESWSVALALRLAALELLRADGGEPILMLDDVFSELDRNRRKALAGIAENTEQVLITAAVAEDVPENLVSRVVRVSASLSDIEGSVKRRVSQVFEPIVETQEGDSQ